MTDHSKQINAENRALHTRASEKAATFFDDDYTGPRFRYGLRNRPAGYANIPDGWIINSNKPHSDFNHGTIDYSYELTRDECEGYELTPVEITPAVCGKPAAKSDGGAEPCVLRVGHGSAGLNDDGHRGHEYAEYIADEFERRGERGR